MLIRANTDGTYSANWTPGAVGLYTIHVTIDGIEIGTSLLSRLRKQISAKPKSYAPYGGWPLRVLWGFGLSGPVEGHGQKWLHLKASTGVSCI